MDNETVNKSFNKNKTEDSIKQEFEQTLSERVARYLSVKPPRDYSKHKICHASSECSLLFRMVIFYGCIALVQAVAEVCKISSVKRIKASR